MKFISKPRVITAQQFVLGQPLPEGVSFHQACEGDAGCSLDGQYFVVTTFGQDIVIDGDWIVPEPDGIHFDAVKPDIMAQNYQVVIDDPEAAPNLTPAALALRSFMAELRNEFRAAAEQALRLGDREAERKMAGYAEQIDALIVVPYQGFEKCGPDQQFSGLQDSKGRDIYEGDAVRLAGYGDYTAEFPFIQLYEASFENNIGEIIGNIYAETSE